MNEVTIDTEFGKRYVRRGMNGRVWIKREGWGEDAGQWKVLDENYTEHTVQWKISSVKSQGYEKFMARSVIKRAKEALEREDIKMELRRETGVSDAIAEGVL